MPPKDEQRKWLKDALGVNTAAPSGGSNKSGNLTDADFPADLKRRKKADEEALKLGKERIEAMNQEKGEGPPEESDDLSDQIIEKGKELLDTINDKLKIPRFSEKEEKPEDTAPLVQFLADMESGTKKAKEYIDYIEKERARMEKIADLTGLDRIAKAGDQLKKINGHLKDGLGKLSGGLGKAGKVIKQAKKVAKLVIALGDFADASKAMKASNRDSVEHWVESLENLWDAGAEFEEELKSQWWEAALAGSGTAVAAAPIIFAASQLFIGIKVLKQGVKNVDAYFDRLDKIMKEIDSDGRRPTAESEPPPAYPGDWETQEEEEAGAQQRKENERKYAEHAGKLRKTQDATEQFDNELFPKIYQANRADLRRKVFAAFRKTAASPESDWWECFMPGGATYDDEKMGIAVTPTKETVPMKEALLEIDNFRGLSKPCRFFKELHDAELKKHLARASKDAR